MSRRWSFPVLRGVIVVVVIALWQWGTANTTSASVASPLDIWNQVIGWMKDGTLWAAILETLITFLLGYVISIVIGTVLGIGSGVSKVIGAYLNPFIIFVNALPKFVLLPLLIAMFGFGRVPGVITIVLTISIVVAITIQASIKDIQGEFIENAIMLGARPAQLLGDVYLPAMGVWIVSSARLAIGLAFQAAVVAEFFGAGNGLGNLVEHGEQTFVSSEIYGGIAVTVVLALIIDMLLSLVDRRVSAWVPQAQS